MSKWTPRELDAVGSAAELDITTRRADGTLRPAVPIWVVRAGDDLCVRSYRARGSAWFGHAAAHGTAHIRAGALDRDGTTHATPMVAGPAAQATLRLTPAD